MIKIIINVPILNGNKAYFLWRFLIIANMLITKDIANIGRMISNASAARMIPDALGEAEHCCV
jgi:hypothetical protein